jgi:hypothetical protein
MRITYKNKKSALVYSIIMWKLYTVRKTNYQSPQL